VDRAFAADSPVRTPSIRAILLEHAAGPDLLRREGAKTDIPKREREAALFTLLYKEVTRDRYADFVRDRALIPAEARVRGPAGEVADDPGTYSYSDSHDTWTATVPLWVFTQPTNTRRSGCPPIVATATRLAQAPGEPRARLCLADFMLANSFDGFFLDSPPSKNELGGIRPAFPGGAFSRLEIYKAIIDDAKAPADDKAYALYSAIWCYGPSGINSCGGVDAPAAQRKAWFLRLKSDYSASPWAQKLKYFW
jgi:hypothetical protein